MKIVVDVNMSPKWAVWLTDAGLPAVYWADLGPATAPDATIMRYAKLHDYVVLTFDLDFGILLAATRDRKPSVVQLRNSFAHPDDLREEVIRLFHHAYSDLQAGALVTLTNERIRIKTLPIL